MWPTSNGYSYTDSNFVCNLPSLCDEAGNIAEPITNFYQDQTPTCCDICSTALSESKLADPNTILPVVIEGPDSRDPHALHAIWPQHDEFQRVYEAAAHIIVSLCEQCQSRAFAIMETSDHATSATGANWPLLVANLRKQLTDPGWDKYDNQKAQERLHRRIAKKLVILSDSQPIPAQQPFQQPTSITELPDDVFGIIGKYLVTAEKHRLATLIQSLYRGWRARSWAHIHNRKYSHEEAKARNLWTVCDDCETHIPVRHTTVIDACADHDGCCYKTVCSTYCRYRCPNHNAMTDTRCNNIIYVHQYEKRHDGDPTRWQCQSCENHFTLHEQWWGLSESQHEARYG
jgi:hypothetical protein